MSSALAEVRGAPSRNAGRRWTAGLLAAALTCGATGTAHADEVAPGGKAVVGGALLGAEIVLITEALLDLKPWWAYLLGGALGAGGGSALGFAVEESGSGGLAVGMLTLGAMLVIPGTIAVVHGTRYRPPADERTTADATRHMTSFAHASAPRPHALLAMEMSRATEVRSVTLTVPTVQVRERVTATEVAIFGAKQGAQFNVPVLDVRF